MKKYILHICIIILIALVNNTKAQECNMLANTNFKHGLTLWKANNMQGGWATYQTAGNELSVTIESISTKIWGIQLTQGEIMVEMSKPYVITFEAKADSTKKINVSISKNGDPWTNYASKEFEITNEWATYTYEYTHTEYTDPNARIELNIGSDITPITFRGINVASKLCLNGIEPLKLDERVVLKREELFAPTVAADGTSSKRVNKEGFQKISVSGYARAYTVYRQLDHFYDADIITPKAIFFNGVAPDSPLENGLVSGYREPMLMLELHGKPTYNTEFGIDMVLDNQLTGQLADSARRLEVYRFVNLNGGISTNFGKFDIKLGGINYLNMSPLTMWRYEIRDDMFERYPWEWSFESQKRYNQYYESNSIAKDSRFGNVAFQGLVVQASGLPKRFGVDLMYGKSDGSNNGFQSFLSNNYKFIAAGRVYKRIARHTVGINIYNQKGFNSNTSLTGDPTNEEKDEVYTIDGQINLKQVKLHGEFGIATFTNSSVQTNDWSPAINIKANVPNVLKTGLKLSGHVYVVGENYLNPNSVATNTNIFGGNINDAERQYNSGSMLGGINEIGQLSNNRKGVSTVFEKAIGKLKVALGLNVSQDMYYNNQDTVYNFITFQQYAAGLNRSRFVYYRAEQGPYSRNQNSWRRSFEHVFIADPTFNSKKNYNTIDLSLKYKLNIGKHSVILTNYTNYNSVTENFGVLPTFNSEAFIRTLYNESMVFFELTPKTTIVAQFGIQQNKGNNRINTADDSGNQYGNIVDVNIGNDRYLKTYIADYQPLGNTIDQIGKSLGLGVDFDITETSGLYIRQKWYSHSDKNFTQDKFNGWETSVELKVRF